MPFFESDDDNEVVIVTYCFLRYQYCKRGQHGSTYAKTKYNPTSLELCKDIASKVTVKTAETGLENTFYHFGITTKFNFDIDNSVTVSFDKDTDMKVLLSEVKLLLTLIKEENGLESSATKACYHDAAMIQMKMDKTITFRADSINSRALGLFLWDYCNERGGIKQRGNQAAAIREIKSADWNETLAALGYTASDETVFRKLIRRTDLCIQKSEVLAL